jgi:hypothetical protein
MEHSAEQLNYHNVLPLSSNLSFSHHLTSVHFSLLVFSPLLPSHLTSSHLSSLVSAGAVGGGKGAASSNPSRMTLKKLNLCGERKIVIEILGTLSLSLSLLFFSFPFSSILLIFICSYSIPLFLRPTSPLRPRTILYSSADSAHVVHISQFSHLIFYYTAYSSDTCLMLHVISCDPLLSYRTLSHGTGRQRRSSRRSGLQQEHSGCGRSD